MIEYRRIQYAADREVIAVMEVVHTKPKKKATKGQVTPMVIERKGNPQAYAGKLAAVDAGRRFIKVGVPGFTHVFDSCIGEARELRLDRPNHDYTVEIDGQRFFVGDLAQESRSRRYPHAKVSPDTRIRMLAALALVRPIRPLRVITCVPVAEHSPTIKAEYESLLVRPGPTMVTLNGDSRVIEIEAVDVLPEGAAGLWSLALNEQGQQVWNLEEEPLVRYFDLGSMTCNGTTMINGVWRDVESFTLPYGGFELEHNGVTPMEFAARFMADLKIQIPHLNFQRDKIVIGGGVAARLGKYLTPYFGNATVHPDPMLANVLGCLRLGVAEYGEDY